MSDEVFEKAKDVQAHQCYLEFKDIEGKSVSAQIAEGFEMGADWARTYTLNEKLATQVSFAEDFKQVNTKLEAKSKALEIAVNHLEFIRDQGLPHEHRKERYAFASWAENALAEIESILKQKS